MAAADAAWLQMDSPENRMIITSLMDFDERLDPARLEETLEKLAGHPRFRRRVVPALTALQLPWWEEDARFDLQAHVHHLALPAPGDEEQLRQFVGERMSTGLDLAKPLWELDVIEKRRGTALLLRVHHCVGDGVALVRLLLGLADAAVPLPAAVGRPPPPALGPIAWGRQQVLRLKALVDLLLVPRDPQVLRARLGLVKRAAWSSPVPLQSVRELARQQGATVNDVLMGALAGALREALQRKGRVPRREVRAMVPLYLRGAEGSMGNHFGLVYLRLPVTQTTREARIAKLKKRMGLVKATQTAPVAFDILRGFGAAGAAVERIGVRIFTAKASIMVTNVPGPQTRVQLAGRPLSSLMTWAPTSGHMAMAATLITYAGEVRIGVCADAHLGVDPEAVVRDFERELAAAPREPAVVGGGSAWESNPPRTPLSARHRF